MSQAANMKRVCYYAIPNPDNTDGTLKDLLPESIDPHICTHIVVAFAKIVDGFIVPKNSMDLQIYERVLNLKKINPDLKVMLSLNEGFEQLVRNDDTIVLLAYNAAEFLKKHGFDGLDLDWEFPSWPAKPGNGDEKTQFTYLVTQLSNSLRLSSHPPLSLSIAVAAPSTIVKRSYEVEQLARNVDWINLMCYDFRIFWYYFPFTGHNAPLHKSRFDVGYFATLNTEWASNYWVRLGTPKSKLVVGAPTYGRTWKLLSSRWHKVGAPAVGIGWGRGYVSYPEAISFLGKGAVRYFDPAAEVPFFSLGKTWASYEDEDSMRRKVQWIKNSGFAGVMTWNLNCDDFNATVSPKPFPLHRVIRDELGQ